jgi:hypothetical protein
MKLTDLAAHFVPLLGVPMSDITETLRFLKEGSSHFKDVDDVPDLKGRRGPGGGVDAEPFNSAFLLLAILIDGPRREAAISTWNVWHFVMKGSIARGSGDDFRTIKRCELTGAPVFGEALKAIMSSEDIAARVKEIVVSNPSGWAKIIFDSGQVSAFREPHRHRELGIDRSAAIRGPVLNAIRHLISRD